MSYDPQDATRRIVPPPVVSGSPARPYDRPPPAFLAPPPAPSNRPKWPFVALAAAAVVLGFSAWTAYDRGVILKDSGIKACEAMRDGETNVNGTAGSDEPMTEAQYRELREVFEDSRHDDIKDHGTKLMDVVWQMSQLGEDAGMGALVYLQPLTTHMTGLQSACADQGIIVTLKPVADASAAPPAQSPAQPACADVFKDGLTIDAATFDGTCTDAAGNVTAIALFDCADGRTLYQVDAQSGASAGWGFRGETFKAVADAAGDPEYSDALQSCYA